MHKLARQLAAVLLLQVFLQALKSGTLGMCADPLLLKGTFDVFVTGRNVEYVTKTPTPLLAVASILCQPY